MKKTLCLLLVAVMMFSVFSVTISAADAKVVVTSTKVYNDGILVQWKAVEGAVSYILYRKNSADGEIETIKNIKGLKYLDKNIEFTSKASAADAIAYTYGVAAVMADNSVVDYTFDGKNNTCEAKCLCAKLTAVTKPASVYEKGYTYKYCAICGYETKKIYTAQLAPETPVINQLSTVASGIYLKWNIVDGAKEYIVYRKTAKGQWARIAVTSKTAYIDKTAKSGVAYYYTVRATSGVKTSAYKASAAVKFLSMPSDFKIANTAKAIGLNWEKVAGATLYKVYRMAAGDESYTLIGKGTEYKTQNAAGKTITRVKFVDTTAEAGVDYIYTVKAVDGKFQSLHYTKAVENRNAIRRLTAPELTSITNEKEGILVQWAGVEGAKGYYVYRKTTKGWLRIGTVNNARSTAYLVRDDQQGGVINSKTNTYTVVAYSDASRSTYVSAGIKLLRVQQPNLNSAKSIKSGVYVKWNTVPGAEGYIVYSRTPGKGWNRVGVVKGVNTFIDKSAKKGVTYIYTVKAFKGNTVSSFDRTGLTVKDLY